MNVNKRFDRFKQWAGERMGGEVKTSVSDDFKALETEMGVRHEGIDRIHKSMTTYVKSISKRNEGDDKEKTLPIAQLGGSMITHGEDYDANSEYGRCLTMFGRAEERLARIQEAYIAQATSSWLESLERSLTQLKDYQASRKKLDSRRLAYDTSLSKMQKAKREDYRVEEELRTQKVKYEEANDDVHRRMLDIKHAEPENVMDLHAFLDAQLSYHDQCREVLLRLKNEWPSEQSYIQPPTTHRGTRSRSNTGHSFHERYEPLHEEQTNAAESRPIIRSNTHTLVESPARKVYGQDTSPHRPVLNRTPTFEGPAQLRHVQEHPASTQWASRANSENFITRRNSVQVRPASRVIPEPADDAGYHSGSVSDRSDNGWLEPRASPFGNSVSRRTSSSTLNSFPAHKKAPPPPPPSRAKKPAPPPPMKRPLISAAPV
ncbi:Putative BAR domain protein (AFU_orthologue; AFUA_5G06340) [Aspergillus calidoustus]|uniref:Putative BAR domain protein (AFU_orthologue AFUA_5G06340) n=1 Tax=Aspergillus calidoustus TaxID=454130 RepID=A0A0U5GGR3_ASPCI|nr:Putative BAR domain protein (AFU_orthologue; AFUA_5G06340) [Aspergillus calidoustus]